MNSTLRHPTRGLWVASAFAAFILAGAVATLGWPPVFAQENDGDPVQKIVGSYEVAITAGQVTPVSGAIHFIVIVLDATTQQAVPGARVLIQTKNELDSIEGWAHAFNTPEAPERYEADVILGATGTWKVNVSVSSDLGDVLVELLSVEVPKASGGYTAGAFALVGVSVVLVLGGGYVWWAIRREQRKRVTMPAHDEPQQQAVAESDQSDSGKVEQSD